MQVKLPRIDLLAPALCIFTLVVPASRKLSSGVTQRCPATHARQSTRSICPQTATSFNSLRTYVPKKHIVFIEKPCLTLSLGETDFDVAHIETFAVLLVGACLHIPTEFDRVTPMPSMNPRPTICVSHAPCPTFLTLSPAYAQLCLVGRNSSLRHPLSTTGTAQPRQRGGRDIYNTGPKAH